MSDTHPSPLRALAPPLGLGLLLLATLGPVLGDLTGRFLGTATDALHHAWGLWWFYADGREGVATPLVSFPNGERGALLSPLVAWGSVPWSAVGGPALAYNAACIGVILGALGGLGLLAARLVGRGQAVVIALLALLVGRPLYAQLGLGVLEGLILGPAAVALWGLLVWGPAAAPEGWRRLVVPAGYPLSFGLGLVCAVAVMENPYVLVLVAPAAGLAALLRLGREGRGAVGPVAAALLGGLLGVGLRLLDAGGDLGGNTVVAVHFRWAGRMWSALEGEGGLSPLQLLSPVPVADLSAGAFEIREVGGHVYLGLSVLALAAVGAVLGGGVGRAGLGVAAGCLLLAAGSLPGGQEGLPGPFFFLNLGLSKVLPPLTQPVRFLSLASGALAISAAAGVNALAKLKPDRPVFAVAALALTLDGLALGGPSLNIPLTDLRQDACFADLGALAQGGVHLVAPRAMSGEQANSAAIRLQLLHRLPGTHRGIGGWAREPRDTRFDLAITAIGAGLARSAPSPALRTALREVEQRGLAWLIVASDAAPRWLGRPLRSCDGWSAWSVRELNH